MNGKDYRELKLATDHLLATSQASMKVGSYWQSVVFDWGNFANRIYSKLRIAAVARKLSAIAS